MITPAYELLVIENETDYTPATPTSSPIYQIIATKTNTTAVTIETLSGSTVTFPAGSLVAGAKYDILVKSIAWTSTDASFIGCRFKRLPFGMDIE